METSPHDEGVRRMEIWHNPRCSKSRETMSLLTDAGLGRLNITTADGLSADRSCYETLYTFGGRSFSILDAAGTSVFDSGDAFEQLLAEVAEELNVGAVERLSDAGDLVDHSAKGNFRSLGKRFARRTPLVAAAIAAAAPRPA